MRLSRRQALLSAAALGACAKKVEDAGVLAERYVKLVLGIGNHAPKFVDAYYGPAEWKPAKESVSVLLERARVLVADLEAIPQPTDMMAGLRREYLLAQTRACLAYLNILNGRKYAFDEECALLYGTKVPPVRMDLFVDPLKNIEKLLPGSAPLHERLAAFESRFFIPAAKLDTVFKLAVEEARTRTKKFLTDLPAKESFDIEYVQGKVWSAYNWYRGNAHSLIQVNNELPIDVDRIIHLASHEGYPGHHVYNMLLEQKLLQERGWSEFSVYALYSPQSVIAEGTADYGVSLVFPPLERLRFKKEVLFPAAGLDPKTADEQHALQMLRQPLQQAAIAAARAHLDDGQTESDTMDYMQRYLLYSRPMAERRLRFIQSERAYIINYSHGEELVASYLRKNGGSTEMSRWAAFANLLSTPRTPSNLL